MQLKYTFEWVTIDDEILAVPIGDDNQGFHGIIKVNETTQAIMNLLKDETDETTIIATLANNYPDTPLEKIKAYTAKTLSLLRDNNLLSA